MNIKNWLLTICLIFIGFAAPAKAQEHGFLGLSIGYYDVLSNRNAVDFRLEYRPNKSVVFSHLKPWMGLEVTSNASLWAGAGLLYDWEVHEKWHIIPSLGLGYYAKGSSDLDLDYPLEFRSQLELAYEYDSGDRLGLAFSHMSNGSLGAHNRGTEVVSLYWHIPF